jgi:hypothetical protein
MFSEHRARADQTRATQEAVKVLKMAGMHLGDPRAEDLLRKGKVSEAVIERIKELAEESRAETEKTGEGQMNSVTPATTSATEGKQGAPRKVIYNEKTNTYEAAPLQDGMAIEELHMSLNDIDAYNNRYAKFGSKKKLSAHQMAKLNRATTAEAAVGNTAALDEEALLQSQLDSLVPSQGAEASSSTAEGSNPMLKTILQAHLKQAEDKDKVCICQRCFRLQNYNQVDAALRPGWSSNELLTPERFEKLLKGIKDTPSVVLCLVDIFDLRGSILRNLKGIVGNNPLVIAANKVDLLPSDVSMLRLTNWIHSEIKEVCGYYSPQDAAVVARTGSAPRPAKRVHGKFEEAEYDDEALQKYLDDESEALAKGRKKDMYEYKRVAPGQAEPEGDDEKMSAKERKSLRAKREANTLRLADVHLVSCQTGMAFAQLCVCCCEAFSHGNDHGVFNNHACHI